MYHRDWLMRQIEMITATLGYLLTGRSESIVRLEEKPVTHSGTNELTARLLALVGAGEYCRGENELFAALESGESGAAEAAVEFYAALNRLSDETLAAGDFSREEIEDGLREVCDLLGLAGSIFPEEKS